MAIPQDPVILLSYINTQLRDYYSDLDDLCSSLALDKEQLIKKLLTIEYSYDDHTNQFI